MSMETLADEKETRSAYDRVLPRMKALPTDALRLFRTNATRTAGTALNAVAPALALRERAAEELPRFDLSHIANLRDHALALLYTQGLVVASESQTPDRDFDPDTARPFRDLLFTAAIAHSYTHPALFDRGYLEKHIAPDHGHDDTVRDLLGLAELFDKALPQLQGRTAVTAEHVSKARTLATQLATWQQRQESTQSTARAAASEERQRAYTLLVDGYEEVLRAARYVYAREPEKLAAFPSTLQPYGTRRAGSSDPVTEGEAITEGAQPAAV